MTDQNPYKVDPENNPIEHLFYRIQDPDHLINGQSIPATTTLLYRICDNDPLKFEEACELLRIFMMAAYEHGRDSRET